MPKRTRLKRKGSKARKTRLKHYTKKQIDKIYDTNKRRAGEFAEAVIKDIEEGSYTGGVIHLTYGFVPQYRDVKWIDDLYHDDKLPEGEFDFLYEEFGNIIEDMVYSATEWSIIGDPADGTVLLAVSPNTLREMQEAGDI